MPQFFPPEFFSGRNPDHIDRNLYTFLDNTSKTVCEIHFGICNVSTIVKSSIIIQTPVSIHITVWWHIYKEQYPVLLGTSIHVYLKVIWKRGVRQKLCVREPTNVTDMFQRWKMLLLLVSYIPKKVSKSSSIFLHHDQTTWR